MRACTDARAHTRGLTLECADKVDTRHKQLRALALVHTLAGSSAHTHVLTQAFADKAAALRAPDPPSPALANVMSLCEAIRPHVADGMPPSRPASEALGGKRLAHFQATAGKLADIWYESFPATIREWLADGGFKGCVVRLGNNILDPITMQDLDENYCLLKGAAR